MTKIHLYFIDTLRRLREVIFDPTSKNVNAGTLNNYNILVNVGSGLSALGSAQVTEPGFSVFLFYSPRVGPRIIHLAAGIGGVVGARIDSHP